MIELLFAAPRYNGEASLGYLLSAKSKRVSCASTFPALACLSLLVGCKTKKFVFNLIAGIFFPPTLVACWFLSPFGTAFYQIDGLNIKSFPECSFMRCFPGGGWFGSHVTEPWKLKKAPKALRGSATSSSPSQAPVEYFPDSAFRKNIKKTQTSRSPRSLKLSTWIIINEIVNTRAHRMRNRWKLSKETKESRAKAEEEATHKKKVLLSRSPFMCFLYVARAVMIPWAPSSGNIASWFMRRSHVFIYGSGLRPRHSLSPLACDAKVLFSALRCHNYRATCG